MIGWLVASGLAAGWLTAALWRVHRKRSDLADRLRWYTLR